MQIYNIHSNCQHSDLPVLPLLLVYRSLFDDKSFCSTPRADDKKICLLSHLYRNYYMDVCWNTKCNIHFSFPFFRHMFPKFRFCTDSNLSQSSFWRFYSSRNSVRVWLAHMEKSWKYATHSSSFTGMRMYWTKKMLLLVTSEKNRADVLVEHKL